MNLYQKLLIYNTIIYFSLSPTLYIPRKIFTIKIHTKTNHTYNTTKPSEHFLPKPPPSNRKHFDIICHPLHNQKNMLGTAVERKPKIEQVNLTGGRLIREAKVCRCLNANKIYFFLTLCLKNKLLLIIAGFTHILLLYISPNKLLMKLILLPNTDNPNTEKPKCPN